MRRYLWVVGFIGLVGLIGFTGCTKPVLRDKPPPDPLLTSKKPIEGKQHLGDARPVSTEEMPAPPPKPPFEEEDRAIRLLGIRPVGAAARP